jgi:hypothetical protein
VCALLQKHSRLKRQAEREAALGKVNMGPREIRTFLGPRSLVNESRRPRLGRDYAWLISATWAKSQGLENMPTQPMPAHWAVHRLSIPVKDLDEQDRGWIADDESLWDVHGDDINMADAESEDDDD